jgi:hypothetical protein
MKRENMSGIWFFMKKDKGFILLEGFLGIFLLFIVGGAALQGFCQGTAVWNAVMREMEMRQVSRDLKSRLGSYFYFRCHKIRIEKKGRDTLITGSSAYSSKRTAFYLGQLQDRDYPTLYVSVKQEGGDPGINPLLPPQIGANNLIVTALPQDRVQWEMDLIHIKSGKTYHFREVFPYAVW